MLSFLILVFFFTLLILLEASSWRRKTEVALHRSQTAAVLGTMPVIADKVRSFMLIRTVVGIVSGILAALWLWLLGVDFAVFWGVLFFLLNYLPNIGSILAGVPPTVLAFVQLGFGWGLLAAGGADRDRAVHGQLPRSQADRAVPSTSPPWSCCSRCCSGGGSGGFPAR